MNENENKPGYTLTHVCVIGVVLLLAGLAAGYFVRGYYAKKKAAAATVAAPAPMLSNVPQQPRPEVLKHMAEEMSKPIEDKLKTDPKNPALLIQLGDLRFDAAEYKEAITYYERSLEFDPKNTRVRADMANAYAYTGNPDRAISEYQSALKYDPKQGLSLFNLGMVQWHDKGDVKSAIETWEKLIKVNPQFAQQVQVDKLIAKAKEHVNMPAPTQAK